MTERTAIERQPLFLDNQLCFALYAATNAIVRSYRPLLAAIDLTYPQYLVMLSLWQDGPSTTRRIADRLRLAPNAITPLIDRLEAAQLVRRERDTNDRRVIHVILTDRGLALRSEASDAQHEVACATGLSLDGLEDMRGSLIALAEQLEGPARG